MSTATIPAVHLAVTPFLGERLSQTSQELAGHLSDYTFYTKYAPYRANQKRRETWEEAVDRVISMHEQQYVKALTSPETGPRLRTLIHEVRDSVDSKLVLGSQRALQFGGRPVLEKNERMFNCTSSYCDRPRFFQESLYLLLCGTGVGASVQTHHIARLPPISQPNGERATYAVPDTIEGWSDALGVLMSSYFTKDQPFPRYAGKSIRFDFSLIRKEGSAISSGIGKAPGPEPLRRSLEMVRALLDARLAERGNGSQLAPIDAYDILMHTSDAVFAGGVRRSATICVFSAHDQAMITAKTGNWFQDNPQRGRSNNSALLVRKDTTFAAFESLMHSVKEFGEPGFVWADDTEVLYNPCVEISMYPVDVATGKSGWQFCNLCEINGKACTDEATFSKACRTAAILGTLQAGYTNFPYLGHTTEAITRREALLGVSMTGMADNPDIALNPDIQRRGAKTVLDLNEEVAGLIGINPAARATGIKPAGTTSCLLGTASGIHPHHAARYFRRVQANMTEAPFQHFQKHNPRAVAPSVWNPNRTDQVITFLMEAPKGAVLKGDLSAIALLQRVRLTQNNWVDAGKRPDRCAKPGLRHNVSNTITVGPKEWEGVTHYIYEYRQDFAGISLLPEGGDLDYPQAPFCAVPTAEDIVRDYGVGSIMASGLIVDGLKVFNNDLWAACSTVLGRGESLQVPVLAPEGNLERYQEAVGIVVAKKNWVRRAHKFAKNYFYDDLKHMTYCLKRVHNCKEWEDLAREYLPVKYSLLEEMTDNTNLNQTIACAGGKCDLQ